MPDLFLEILNTNGNNHHSKVVSKFRTLGWQTLVSPYYSDNITDKSREIDVIVERDFTFSDRFDDISGLLRLRLFLECKYITQETVIWFDNKDMGRTRQLIDNNFGAETTKYQYRAKSYHYGQDTKVAKLFGSKKDNADNEIFSKAISQCLNAYIYFKHETTSPVANHFNVTSTISYPVIVCSSFDKLRKVDMEDSTQKLSVIDEPFQLEVNYAFLDREKRPCNEFFLIDVITLDQIDDYILNLEEKDVSEKKSEMVSRPNYPTVFTNDSDDTYSEYE